MALATISNMSELAKARVLAQYQPATTRFVALVTELAGQVQEAETAIFGLLAQLSVATASGLWLERLGAIVGENREGLTDDGLSSDGYRAFINGRVLANKSQGTVEELYAISHAAAPVNTFALSEQPPAAMQLVVGNAMTDLVAQRFARLLGVARAVGVRLSVLYNTLPDSNTFTFSSGTSLEASSTLGFGDSSNPSTGGGMASAINA
jgi:hypothetical protein